LELLGVLLADELPLRVRRELQNVVQLLQCYLRAVELEMRAAEEPLRGNLDVVGLKAQVLARIEVLEEQERKKEELLAQVDAVAEEHGLDVEPLKAVLGG
jgi:nucleotide-binding universal stress UspA family protein